MARCPLPLGLFYYGLMQAPATPPPPRQERPVRRFFLTLVLLALAFGLGYVPGWMETRALRKALKTTEVELQLARAHRQLGLASHEAQRSNFASASEAAATFFDQCATLARAESLAEDSRTQVALLAYTSQRDGLMALLASGDPASREQLANLFLTMNGVLERRREHTAVP